MSAAPRPPGISNADPIIVASALVVGGTYVYRRLIETGGVKVTHPLPSFGRWATGYGLAFFGIAIAAEASPTFGAWMAVLVAAGTVLYQGGQLAVDVNQRLTAAQAPQKPTTPTHPATG